MSAADFDSVLRRFLPHGAIRHFEPLGSAGGWSGSLIWRVTVGGDFLASQDFPATPAGSKHLCLRRWPAATSPDRLLLIHYVLTHVAARGINFVPLPMAAQPTGETFVEQGGHYWELTAWLPGLADYRTRPSRERLAAAMQALARFHVASQGSGVGSRESGVRSQEPGVRSGSAPALVERSVLVEQLLSGEVNRIADACRQSLAAELDSRAGRILSLAGAQLPRLATPLRSAMRVILPLEPAIRDIHHDHVLFTGDEVTGIIDFGALRIDTPLADVARLVGSLVGDDQSAREFAFQSYHELRPLTAADRELIDLLDRSNVVLSGLNWLRWLYAERRDMGPLAPIIARLDEICFRLQNRAQTLQSCAQSQADV